MRPLPVLLAACLAVTPAVAQEPAGTIALELNALQPADGGCRISFVATNGIGVEIARAGFEVALFGADGGIERLVSLDFQQMPEGKTKVLQFVLKDLDCDGITRVLVNDVGACDGEGLDPRRCLEALRPSTRLDLTFGL
jgi:hypothetical protein